MTAAAPESERQAQADRHELEAALLAAGEDGLTRKELADVVPTWGPERLEAAVRLADAVGTTRRVNRHGRTEWWCVLVYVAPRKASL